MLNVIQDDLELTRRGFVTNYPDFRQWRKEAAEQGLDRRPLNVYLHLPYCIQRCAYCHYKTTTLRSTQLSDIDRYVDSLCREIEIADERSLLATSDARRITVDESARNIDAARGVKYPVHRRGAARLCVGAVDDQLGRTCSGGF